MNIGSLSSNADPSARRRFNRALPVWSWCALIACLLLIQGCAPGLTRKPVPDAQLALTATIPGIENARFWGDEPPAWLATWEKMTPEEIRANFPAAYGRPHNYLAISGGGSDGAFGAGLLNGWTAAGTRPEFTIVTGISTGALIAPFAFLGPKYDPVLRQVYTGYATKDLVVTRPWLSILASDSVAETSRLRGRIAEYLSEEVMQEIAAAHRQGRRLFIGTVNLDLGRPVIWNIGAIANSGQPGALDLIRDIMLASASIPGAFPPVYIPVEAGGQRYDEMHVDGGTATQVFLYPVGIDWRVITGKLNVPGRPRAYIIRNSKINPDWEAVRPRLVPIAGRSVSSLLRTQGIGDLYRLYYGALRDGIDYNLTYVPESFDVESREIFDPVYMNALFDLAYRQAKAGYPWRKAPPGL